MFWGAGPSCRAHVPRSRPGHVTGPPEGRPVGIVRSPTMSVLNLETIECRRGDGVAWLVLNRPDALNAWTRQLGEELTQALDDVAADPAVRAIVLTGAGRAFSSGADLRAGVA